MKYTETTVHLGDVTIAAPTHEDLVARWEIPERFGTALSLVASVSTEESAGSEGYLWWWLSTSLDGEYWMQLESPGDLLVRAMKAGGRSGLRVHGPFGDRLAVEMVSRESNRLDDRRNRSGLWKNVKVRLGMQWV